MTIKKTDKDQLLENATYLFMMKGYHNTSIADIAGACNLSKGSVYHYITSKKELAITVINQLHHYFREQFFSLAYQDQISPNERLVLIVQGIEKFFLNSDGGSLMGNLVLETVDTVPEFAEFLRNYFSEWIAAISHILSSELGSVRANEVAEDAVAHMQGAIMMMRLYKGKTNMLKRAGQRLIEILENKTLIEESAEEK